MGYITHRLLPGYLPFLIFTLQVIGYKEKQYLRPIYQIRVEICAIINLRRSYNCMQA